MFEVIPLGTGSAVPTRHRHLSALAVRREGQLLLFDCGEGTQHRMLHAGLKHPRLDAVFITHLHGDHLFGLPGLLTTMAMSGRADALTLVGPEGLGLILDALPGTQRDVLPFEVRVTELADDFTHAVAYDHAEYTVEARRLDHRVFCAGYRLQEKPRAGKVDAAKAGALGLHANWHFRTLKQGEAVTLDDGRVVQPEDVIGPQRPGAAFAYCLDTVPTPGAVALAANVDLLVHEATFGDDMLERALETGHATARQAAETAREAGAGRLLLTHFSARYNDVQPLVAEARQVFENTEAAEELKAYAVAPR
jgi:ribonuclease Z